MSKQSISKADAKQDKPSANDKSSKKSNTIQPPINEVVQEKIEELKESYDNFLYVSKAFPTPTSIHYKPAAGYMGFHQHHSRGRAY